MKHTNAMLWTVACALLFYWFVSFASLSLINAQHNPVVTHYDHKICSAPGGYGGGK